MNTVDVAARSTGYFGRVFRSRGQRTLLCNVCRQDRVLDRTGRVRQAVVRVEFGRAPYGARLCTAHLLMLERSNLPGGVHIVERYD